MIILAKQKNRNAASRSEKPFTPSPRNPSQTLHQPPQWRKANGDIQTGGDVRIGVGMIPLARGIPVRTGPWFHMVYHDTLTVDLARTNSPDIFFNNPVAIAVKCW